MKVIESTNPVAHLLTHRPKSGSGVYVTFEPATKALVDGLLAMNVKNRKPRKAGIDILRRSIREGYWMLTNQGIGITRSHEILDGQHRLFAIRAEGYPPGIELMLVWNLEPDARKYVDTGIVRRMPDILRMFMDTNIGSNVVACINVILKTSYGWRAKFLPDDLLEVLTEKGDSISAVFAIERAGRLPAPVLAALVDAHHETGGDARILKFTAQVASGEMIAAGDPAFALRNWSVSMTQNSGGSEIQRERYVKTRSMIDAFMVGKKMHKCIISQPWLTLPCDKEA